jgi:hypothetical protein
MQRLSAASCLLFAFLPGAAMSLAAERITVQVIETHTGVRLGSTEQDSDQVRSICDESSGRYTRDLGFHCADAGLFRPASDYEFFYDLRVIMPDDAHLVFHCSTILSRSCEGFPEYPKNTSIACSDFVFLGRAYKDCTATGPASQAIGVYQAALHGNRMTILGGHWRRNYLHSGTWGLEALAAQDSKPAPPQDDKPAASPQANPAPAAPAPTEAKSADTPPVASAVASAADQPASQLIDPRVIEQAKAGVPEAQYKLGYDYFLGRGVPLDYVQAAVWWRKAADQGYPKAQNNLGVLYNLGKGVPQSYAEAYFWQNLAASRASGSEQTQFAKNRDESGSKLWTLSRLKVQQRAAKWAADHPVPARAHEPQPEEKRSENP